MPDNTALVLVAWGLVAAGCLGLAFLTAVRALRGQARELWLLMGSEALIVACATTPFLFGQTVIALALAALAARTGWEASCVSFKTPSRDAGTYAPLLGSAMVLAFAAFGWFAPTYWVVMFCAVVLLATLACSHLMADTANGPEHSVNALARVAAFPGIALALYALLARDPNLHVYALLGFILVEVFDSLALFGGKLFGRTPAFPRLSPRKTVEGLATGFGALLVASAVLNYFIVGMAWGPWLALVSAIAAAAVLGDLVASAGKRRAGVKDYPPVLAIQGGALDIADAWLVASPAGAGIIWLVIG